MVLFLLRGNISTISKLLSLTISVEATFQHLVLLKPLCIKCLVSLNANLLNIIVHCLLISLTINNKSQYKTDLTLNLPYAYYIILPFSTRHD